MARNDAEAAARRKQRKLEKLPQGLSCAGYTLYEKFFIRLVNEKMKYGRMEKDDPKRSTQRGVVRGLAIAIKMWQEFHTTPEQMTLKEIEAHTPWDEIPRGNLPKKSRPMIDGKNPFDV